MFENIRKFLTYILTSNIPEIVPYLAFVLFRIPLPLTIIQILAVDLGTDMLPALALGAEKPDPGGHAAPAAAARGERLLSPGLIARAYLFLGHAGGGGRDGGVLLRPGCRPAGSTAIRLAEPDPLYLQATTACLAAIVADAGRQRLPVPPSAEIVAVLRPAPAIR